ncbi:response regulator transcription factor [Actinomycetaceae bacterium MB13-C1-2]|nr:response regulator transcription factor [Actinomycetaceae bacterium MB13-C1-2]
MIQVMVVDDHPVVRAGIVAMVQSDPEIVVSGEAGNGVEALDLLEDVEVDVVLTDLRMPQMDGVSLTAALATRAELPRVVVLTTYDSDAEILRAVEAGAVGYLLKDAPKEQIIEGVRAAAAGHASLSPRVAAALVARVRAPEAATLTVRETEVLELVASGATNSQIARGLGVSLGTVKAHLEHSYTKLDARDRASAVAKAIAAGIIR